MTTKAQALDHLTDVLAGEDVAGEPTVAGAIDKLASMIEDGDITIGGGGGGNTFVIPVHWAWVDSGFKPSTSVTNDEIKAAYTAKKAIFINNDGRTYPSIDTIPARWSCSEYEFDIDKLEIIWADWHWDEGVIPDYRLKYSVETSKFYSSERVDSSSNWGSWTEF